MANATMTPLNGCQPRHFARDKETVALWLSGDGELWQGLAPDNPAIRDLSYLVMRNHLPQARFVCLWDFANRAPLTEVNVHHTPAGTHITFWRGDRVTHVTLYDEGKPANMTDSCYIVGRNYFTPSARIPADGNDQD